MTGKFYASEGRVYEIKINSIRFVGGTFGSELVAHKMNAVTGEEIDIYSPDPQSELVDYATAQQQATRQRENARQLAKIIRDSKR